MRKSISGQPTKLSWFTPILYSQEDNPTRTDKVKAKVKEYVEAFFYFGNAYAAPLGDSKFKKIEKHSSFLSKTWKCLTYLAIASPILITGGKKKTAYAALVIPVLIFLSKCYLRKGTDYIIVDPKSKEPSPQPKNLSTSPQTESEPANHSDIKPRPKKKIVNFILTDEEMQELRNRGITVMSLESQLEFEIRSSPRQRSEDQVEAEKNLLKQGFNGGGPEERQRILGDLIEGLNTRVTELLKRKAREERA